MPRQIDKEAVIANQVTESVFGFEKNMTCCPPGCLCPKRRIEPTWTPVQAQYAIHQSIISDFYIKLTPNYILAFYEGEYQAIA